MKKLMVALLLVCGVANAEQWLELKNTEGGVIVFTGTETKNCGAVLKWMYATAKDGTAYYGCWTYLNGKVHAVYDSGERRVYDTTYIEAKGDK
jgi:hypothetical protein